jgi:hypothetical protein
MDNTFFNRVCDFASDYSSYLLKRNTRPKPLTGNKKMLNFRTDARKCKKAGQHEGNLPRVSLMRVEAHFTRQSPWRKWKMTPRIKAILLPLAITVLFTDLLTGCSSSLAGGGGSNTPTVNVLPPPNTNIDQGDSTSLAATTQNDSSEGVTWSLSGTGCTGSACGTLTNASTYKVTYNAPSTVTSSTSVKVTATMVKDTSVTSSVNLTVVPPPVVSPLAGALPAGATGTAYSTTLTVTGGIGPYQWNQPTGNFPPGVNFSSTSGGTVNLSGTPTLAGHYTFTITVTDSGNPTSLTSPSVSYSIDVTSNSSLSIITTSLPNGVVNTNYSSNLQATGGSGGYSWSLAAGSGPLPTGITLSSSGSISGTTGSAGSYPITVEVTDSNNDTKTQSLTLVINNAVATCSHDGSGNAVLNGNYAFHLSGFDTNGSPYQEIGDFFADGNGNISNGNADANGLSFAGTQTEQPYTFSGTYSVGSTDNRGVAYLNNTNTAKTGLPAMTTYCFAAESINNGVASSGRIVEADGSGFLLTGFYETQTTTDFTPNALANPYAFGIQGANNGNPEPQRSAAIGQFALNNSSGVTGGQLDFANYSNGSSSTTYIAQAPLVIASSRYTLGSNGRGTLTLAISNGGNTASTTLVFYIVGTANKLLLMTSDASKGLLGGQALEMTKTTFSASDMSNSVFRAVKTTNPASTPIYDDVIIGWLGFDGVSSVSLVKDENAGGTITSAATGTGSYAVSSIGYVTVTAASHPPAFYLYAPSAGFGLDGSNGITFFTLSAQTVPNGGFTSANLSGNTYSFGTLTPVAYNSQGGSTWPLLIEGVADFASNGSLNGTTDDVSAPGLLADLYIDQSFADNWALDTTTNPAGSTTGRFIITKSGTGGATTTIGYIVNGSSSYLIDVKSGEDSLSQEGFKQ